MYVKGVGNTKYGIQDKPTHLLAYEATLEALNDADMSIKDIDAIVVSTVEWFFNGERQRHFASLLSGLFKTRVPIVRIPAACAGGGAAFYLANTLGYDNVLALGVEKLIAQSSEAITDEYTMAAESKWEQTEGLCFPAINALVAQEYLNKYSATTDDFALVSFKNHSNAYTNEKAFFFNKKVSLEKIKTSPIVASPLRLHDCSISVNGAAAAILSKDKTDIKIAASALCTDSMPPFERKDITTWDATIIASKEAYEKASVSPKDIDFAEVHDAFTSVELIAYEDLGFAKKGEGAKLIRDGVTNIDGKLPVNSSGGLKAKGHPASATGLGQIYEVVKQLRGECKDRQISNPKIGLAQNIGGAGGTITVNIFRKIGA